jgi:hypothetical protein
MQAQKETVGLATGKEGRRSGLGIPKTPSDPATLAEAGIDKNLAIKRELPPIGQRLSRYKPLTQRP